MRKIIVFLLSAVLMVSLTACGGGTTSSDTESVPTQQTTVKTTAKTTKKKATTSRTKKKTTTAKPTTTKPTTTTTVTVTTTTTTQAPRTFTVNRPAGNKPVTVTLQGYTAWREIAATVDLSKGLVLEGADPSVEIDLPPEVNLESDTVFRNLTINGTITVIHANGHKFTVESSVKTVSPVNRLTVFGGSRTAPVASTDITLLVGHYQAVYGGGNGQPVTGDTHVVFGGNVNAGDSNDDTSPDISPCNVYGGGKNAGAKGTHVTVQDDAVAYYVSGVGTGKDGALVDTAEIRIEGGMIMNVYGGSLNANVPSLEATITVTGGLMEGVFGGCESGNMTGSADITLLGGDISRRVYTGCYNNCDVGFLSDTWLSTCHITGETTLTIGPDVSLCTGTLLDYDNSADMGVFCGSRYNQGFDDEYNTLVFVDDCYDLKIGDIGPSPLSDWDVCQSRHDQILTF